MTQLSRVVWSEGMHLAQHHFQAQGRYFEDSLHFALSHLFFKAYGVVGCELDAEALRNGTAALVHARGVMPDGLPFQIPDADAAPPPREIREHFSPTQDSHLLVLAVPAFRDGAANCAPDGAANGAARYVAQPSVVRDEVSGRDERPVSFGRKNFRLLLDEEVGEGDVALPLARVRRDGSGHFIYDPDYVPPSLQIGASPRLMQRLALLVDVLDARSDAAAAGGGGGAPGGQDVASYWLLHAVRTSLPPLRHQLQRRRAHPEQLYTEMARLAGALCTFALDSHPRTLPAYDHDRLEECFGALDAHIRAHLEVIIPTSSVTVPLRASTAPYLFTGTVTDRRCFGASTWILAVRSSGMAAAELAARAPQLIKVCASKFTMELVRRAYPGMKLDYLPAPPPAISPRPQTAYFEIGRAGPCWDTIVSTGEVGVYLPDALPGAEAELVIELES
ncbi:MAG TPA: type VI secretion system baseplate subunit TssK [Gemmatimonadaceae bacterium]|nr:type VI secretion system baseplate subunit TssK [Gemmatimonadaceae bacterium]